MRDLDKIKLICETFQDAKNGLGCHGGCPIKPIDHWDCLLESDCWPDKPCEGCHIYYFETLMVLCDDMMWPLDEYDGYIDNDGIMYIYKNK